jgi:hypothetical protein
VCDTSQDGPWRPLILLLYKIIKNLDFDPNCWTWEGLIEYIVKKGEERSMINIH